MPTLSFKWDSKDLEAWRGDKVLRAMQNAAKKAGGDALRTLRTASSRAVRERKRMKLSDVSKGFKLYYPKTAALSEMEWRLDITAKPTPIAQYPHRQTRKGVSVSINKGTRKLIQGAFVATMKSGHTGVFVRRGSARLPIKELFTTKLTDVFENEDVVPELYSKARSVFVESFSRLTKLEFDRILSK